MMRLLFFLILFGANSIYAQQLTVEQQLSDLDQLKGELEKYHPGLNRYTSQDSMNYFFHSIRNVASPKEIMSFYSDITFLINKVRCGHTRTSLPSAASKKYFEKNKFLPIKIGIIEDDIVIKGRLDENNLIQKGDKVLSINGFKSRDILKLIYEHHSADGFIDTGKKKLTEWYFSFYYKLYVDKNSDSFALEVQRLDGAIENLVLNGQPWERVRTFSPQFNDKVDMYVSHKPTYSYLRISSFVEYSINNSGIDYENFLAETFEELQVRGVENLIIDLRGNGGGKDDYGALLVSYLANRPFKYFEKILVTDDFQGPGIVEEIGSERVIVSHNGLKVWQPKEHAFKGGLYLLIDGQSFSTCADVATVLHHNKWGVFIGEETGGGYDGNTSGVSKSITLTNSGISINLPMFKYITANQGHNFYGRGVIPDYKILPKPLELISEKDLEMEKAIELILEKE